MNHLDVDPATDSQSADQMSAAKTKKSEQFAPPSEIVIPRSQQAPVSQKQRRLESLDPAEFPKSYRQNSDREIAQLEYVEQYRRQFIHQFPSRPELYLVPMNECGVRKFVCSTIRPTLLKFPRTYDLQQTATFVADFVNYIPLETPTFLPDFLPSPSTVVSTREGDCVDLSTLLVSLLRGAGFRAYVVSGYAPMAITLQDLTSVQCPLLKSTQWEDEVQVKDLSAQLQGPAATEPSSNGRYNVHRDRAHHSKHLQMLAEREAAEAAHLAEESSRKAVHTIKLQDRYQDRRVHCWVMVLPGRRDITSVQFIEPSTGIIYQLKDSPYQRIESVWNESNYWINIQKPCELKDLSFDLDHNESWEYILLKDNVNKGERIFDPKTSASPQRSLPLLLEPPSWTSKITITADQIKSVCPDGQKILYFHKCNLEKFAPLSPGKQGLVLRLTLFEDDARQHVTEIREVFEQRKDSLVKRVTLPETNCIKLRYAPGKPSGIQDLIEIPGVQRLIQFYPKSRVDGLVKRTETINKKFVEEFQGCDNRLIRRTVVVDDSDSKMRRLKGFSINPGGANELPVIKLSEHFARNPNVNADQDVKKKVNFIDQGKIAIYYHYGPGRVTAASKVYTKDGVEVSAWNVDGNPSPLQSVIVREEFNALVQSEKELMSVIRQRESELNEVLNQLRAELDESALERNGEDKPRTKSKEQVKIETGSYEDNEPKATNYLAPFLAQFPTGKPLLREQAEQARDECMASLTERLLKRGNIIQRRLNEEYEKLKKRESAYQRNQGAHIDKEEEEYNAFYESTIFRIHILEARLHRHEKMAMKKFRALDLQLRVDPRLEALYKPQQTS